MLITVVIKVYLLCWQLAKWLQLIANVQAKTLSTIIHSQLL